MLTPQDASTLSEALCRLAPVIPVLVIDDASTARALAEALVVRRPAGARSHLAHARGS